MPRRREQRDIQRPVDRSIIELTKPETRHLRGIDVSELARRICGPDCEDFVLEPWIRDLSQGKVGVEVRKQIEEHDMCVLPVEEKIESIDDWRTQTITKQKLLAYASARQFSGSEQEQVKAACFDLFAKAGTFSKFYAYLIVGRRDIIYDIWLEIYAGTENHHQIVHENHIDRAVTLGIITRGRGRELRRIVRTRTPLTLLSQS